MAAEPHPRLACEHGCVSLGSFPVWDSLDSQAHRDAKAGRLCFQREGRKAECQDDPPLVSESESFTDTRGARPEFVLPVQGVWESGFGMVDSLLQQQGTESLSRPYLCQVGGVRWPNEAWSLPREGDR